MGMFFNIFKIQEADILLYCSFILFLLSSAKVRDINDGREVRDLQIPLRVSV